MMVVRKARIFCIAFFVVVVFLSGCVHAPKKCSEPQNYFQSAYEAYQRQDYDTVISNGKKALCQDRVSFDAAFLLAKAYWEKGSDAKTIGYLKKAIRINPSDVRPWVSLGTIYREKEKIKIAIGYFEKALAIDADNASATSGLAQCYVALGDYNNVIDYGKRAIELDPNDVAGHYTLGIAYAQTDAQMAALEQYNILTQLDESLAGKLLPKIKYKKFSSP